MQPKAIIDYMQTWLKEQVEAAGASGVVLGISGGLDSSVAGAIVQRVFPDAGLGLIMPCASVAEDELHGKILVEQINLEHKVIDLTAVYEHMAGLLQSAVNPTNSQKRLLEANLKSRLRMITLYYTAQRLNYLVLGTGNKSELAVGYFTKYGDGGVDLQILGDLMKSEVLILADYLDIPIQIRSKAPSGGLWPGQTDEGEMGITYGELERYLSGLPLPVPVEEKIAGMAHRSQHKRVMAPIAVIPEAMRLKEG